MGERDGPNGSVVQRYAINIQNGRHARRGSQKRLEFIQVAADYRLEIVLFDDTADRFGILRIRSHDKDQVFWHSDIFHRICRHGAGNTERW